MAPPEVRITKKARWLSVLTGLALLATVAYWILLDVFADRHWLGTVVAYTPRFFAYLPTVLVLPIAAVTRHKWHFLANLGGLLVAIFVIGGVEFPGLCRSGPPERTVTLVVQNLAHRNEAAAMAKLVEAHKPDILLLQECQPPGVSIDSAEVRSGKEVGQPDYHLVIDHNLCMLSRYPVLQVLHRDRSEVWKQGGSGAIALYEFDAPMGKIWVQNVHLETIREGLSGLVKFRLGGIVTMHETMAQRELEAAAAGEWAKQAKGPLLIGGDFNLVQESMLMRKHFGEMDNAFDECGLGNGDTKVTKFGPLYFRSRIDHVLSSREWSVVAAEQAVEVGSDHIGLVTTLALR